MTTLTIDKLLIKQSQLQARIQMLQAKENVQKRKDETRKKILVGSYFLNKYEKVGTFETLISELDKFLFRKIDRALFGLAPLIEEEKT